MEFTDSCIAKDFHGRPQIFAAGRVVRMHAENCPQNDGAIDVVDACFYQTAATPPGYAVLLRLRSWTFCKDLELL